MEKRFAANAEGRTSLENEKKAQELFGSKPWKLPANSFSDDRFFMPEMKMSQRLDIVAPTLGTDERRRIAVDVVEAAFDIFFAGFAHRDFHSRNCFLSDGAVLITDFETMIPLPKGQTVAFPDSYDLTGRGLPSPYNTQGMSYRHPVPEAFGNILGVGLEEALELLRGRMKEELREACASFKAVQTSYDRRQSRRHRCRTGRIYGSFSLPNFSVGSIEAQRDSVKRFAKFGLGPDELIGRSVLDLGSNIGAITFTAHSFGAGRCVGVEYDLEKIRVAQKIARFCGLPNVEFLQNDIDHLEEESLGGPFEIVFCLAIESHVASVENLYRVLGRQTKEMLVFEGNNGCNEQEVVAELRRVGFVDFDLKGFCDDDVKTENNRRPVLVARKKA